MLCLSDYRGDGVERHSLRRSGRWPEIFCLFSNRETSEHRGIFSLATFLSRRSFSPFFLSLLFSFLLLSFFFFSFFSFHFISHATRGQYTSVTDSTGSKLTTKRARSDCSELVFRISKRCSQGGPIIFFFLSSFSFSPSLSSESHTCRIR